MKKVLVVGRGAGGVFVDCKKTSTTEPFNKERAILLKNITLFFFHEPVYIYSGPIVLWVLSFNNEKLYLDFSFKIKTVNIKDLHELNTYLQQQKIKLSRNF